NLQAIGPRTAQFDGVKTCFEEIDHLRKINGLIDTIKMYRYAH
ncbi:unnamed protein product, partial [Didymodactylos carnosus]